MASDNTGKRQEIIFHEVQRPRQPWLWAIILAAAGTAWYITVQHFFIDQSERSTGSDIITVIIWVLFGLAFPLFVVIIKLETTVTRERVIARFFPLLTRSFAARNIAFAGARDYKPMREFGGWGIRHSPQSGRAYSISGTRGVQMALKDESLVMIGSQRADELAEAIADIAGITAGIPAAADNDDGGAPVDEQSARDQDRHQ